MDKKSKWGYKKGSEFRNEPFIDIKSNIIDMSETPEDLLLIPNKGKPMIGKANSGQIIFPHAKKVREVPIRKLQHGGNFGLAGENTMPMSPFISLKPFINKYKLKHGGVIDYMFTLPEEQQYLFAEEFDNLDKDTQDEISEYLKGGYYQTGGSVQSLGDIKFDSDKARQKDNYLIVKDIKSKKDFGVQRNPDGTYRFYNKNKPFEYEQDYITEWFNSPETKKRYETSGGIGGYSDELDLEDAMNTAKNSLIYLSEQKTEILKNVKNKKVAEQRLKDIEKGKISGVNLIGKKGEPIIIINKNSKDLDLTVPHELSHNNQVDSNVGEHIKDRFWMNDSDMSNYLKKHPREIHPRLMEIRYQLGIKPGQKVEDVPDEIIKRSQLDKVYDKQTLIDILNTVANVNEETKYYGQKGGVNQYQAGGLPNAELEDQETILTPDGELSKIEGKTHEEGGEDVSLPNQSRIYSEYLKAPKEVVKQVLGKETKKKYSYADLSKRFPTQPSISILTDPNSDDYQKTTAQLTLASNLGKLDTIFYAQEQEKQEKQGKEGNKFQDGGWVSPRRPKPNSSIDIEEPIDWSFLMNRGAGLPSTPYTRTPTTSTFVAPTPLTFFAPVVGLEEEYVPTVPTDLQLVMPERTPRNETTKVVSPVRGKQSVPKRKSNRTVPNSVTADIEVGESDLWQVPLPLEQLPQRTYSNLAPIQTNSVPTVNEVADIIVSSDDQDYPGKKKWDWSKFGISPELAGTVADIGLALSDKLRVSEPTFYNRTKTPLFTRFVDFDDKEVQRMYDKNIQQIQQSNIPEQVKQAQISALTSNYQDYQAKVDFGNLQRYEAKRERDTDKLQRYLDTNIDQRVADIESYRMKKARVDELRNAWRADRKSRIVNSLKQYANYADTISKSNEFTDNYKVNPITGKINFKENQKSDLTSNLLQAYQKRADNKVSLPNGATLTMLSEETGVVTDANGKVEIVKLK